MTTTVKPAYPFSDAYDLLTGAGLDRAAVGRLAALLDIDGMYAVGGVARKFTSAEVAEQLQSLTPAVFAVRHGLGDHQSFVEAFRDELGQVTR